MSAVATLLKAGDKMVMPTDVYGGTYRLFVDVFGQFGVKCTQVDMSDLAAVEKLLHDGVQMLYIESPTNPLMSVYDLTALATLAKKYKTVSVVDNTFASPYFQNPLKFGIDVVLHSASKYIGGHSDIVGGALLTNDKGNPEKTTFARKSIGLPPAPFLNDPMPRS